MIAAKLAVLKDLISQMQQLMSDGHGDDAEAGKEAMESMGDEKAEEEKEAASGMEDSESCAEDDLKSAVREAFKGKPKAPPAKGAMVVMQERVAAPDKKEFPPKKKKAMNYG